MLFLFGSRALVAGRALRAQQISSKLWRSTAIRKTLTLSLSYLA
jgi:hypothetical protein